MLAHFDNGGKCDGSKLCSSVHTMPELFENGRAFVGGKLFSRLCVKEVCLHSENRPISFQKRQKNAMFSSFLSVRTMRFPK